MVHIWWIHDSSIIPSSLSAFIYHCGVPATPPYVIPQRQSSPRGDDHDDDEDHTRRRRPKVIRITMMDSDKAQDDCVQQQNNNKFRSINSDCPTTAVC